MQPWYQAVAGVIRDSNGCILVQKHVKLGKWTIPSGKVDSGLTLTEALKKELWEECGILVEGWELVAHTECSYVREGKNITVDTYVYNITEYSGVPVNLEPEKHNEQTFISEKEVRTLQPKSDMLQLALG